MIAYSDDSDSQGKYETMEHKSVAITDELDSIKPAKKHLNKHRQNDPECDCMVCKIA